MNILLLGSGGREHALAWKLAQSPLCGTLWASPGNPGIQALLNAMSTRANAAAPGRCLVLDLFDHGAVITFCQSRGIHRGRRPRSPARRWPGRFAAFGRHRGVRAKPGCGATGRLEGLHEGLVHSRRHPDRRLRTAPGPQMRPMPRWPVFRFPSSSKPMGSRRARAWSLHRPPSEAAATINDMFGGAFGGAGAEVVIEEFLEGDGSEPVRHHRRHSHHSFRLRAGSQACGRRRYRPQHRRHGCLPARRRC